MLASPGSDMVLAAEIDGIDIEAYYADEDRPAETVVQAWFPTIATKPLRAGASAVAAPGYSFQREGDKIVGRRSRVEDSASGLETALRAAVAWTLTAERP